jgi:hypothetical protein
MCSPCLEMQKPSDIMPDRDALCPDCGKTFGDGPILLPAGHTSYIAPSPAEQAASVEAGTFDYVKDLRSWAGWLIFWTVINTGGMFFGGGGEEELPELSAGEMAVATALGCALIGVGILVFISAIVCLATRPPWPGFYIIFGIYLISIGLLNLTGGGFWSGLGIFQLVISITLFVRYAKYLNAHRAMREFY